MEHRTAFKEQVTEEMAAELRDYARWCRLWYRLPEGSSWDDDVVQDALSDICSGAIRWNVERLTLRNAARDVVCYRTRDEARRRELRGVTEVDPEAHASDTTPEVLLVEKQEAAFVQRLCVAAAAYAVDDAAVQTLLTCVQAGAAEPAEIREGTGWSADELYNARRRAQRLLAQVPDAPRARRGTVRPVLDPRLVPTVTTDVERRGVRDVPVAERLSAGKRPR